MVRSKVGACRVPHGRLKLTAYRGNDPHFQVRPRGTGLTALDRAPYRAEFLNELQRDDT
jgi:hypothetical protein